MRIPADISLRADAIRPGLLYVYVIASLPVVVLGFWQLGQFMLGSQLNPETLSAWDAFIIRRFAGGMEVQSGARASLLVSAFFLTRLIVAMLVSFTWAIVFARWRQRPIDAGWFYLAWWFTLLVPAAVPLPYLVLGLSFGLLFGCHVFGGTGRYIVNPALLGVVFLAFSWPASMSGGWLPGIDAVSGWEQLVTDGHAAMLASGTGWWGLAAGQQVSAVGVGAAGACLAVAIFLVFAGLVPWRIIVGGLAGISIAGLGFAEPQWYWQPVLGSFCFALVFISSDPSTVPESRMGCWALGITFGVLTIVIRMLNPEHPEGSMYALLLAMLLTPLVDHFATREVAEGERVTHE